jgi:phospholipid/cholesterol/gamma-HCH transport system substrate-binding protein
MLREFRRGFGDPDAVGRTIEVLSPTLDTVRRGTKPLLGRERDDLRQLVRSTGLVVAGLGHDEGRLRQLVDGVAGTMRVTAARREDLGRMIELSPPALDSTLITTRRIDSTLARLDPLAIELRAGARRLHPALQASKPALDQTASLLDDARPLLKRMNGALGSLERASRSGRPLMEALEPTIRRLDEDVLPWLHEIDPETGRRTFEMIGPTVASSSGIASEFDGAGYWIRFPSTAGERALLPSPCVTYFTNPTAEEKVRCDQLEKTLGTLFGGAPPR